MYKSGLQVFDDGGTILGGDVAPADPSQRYIDVYVPTENGQGMMEQRINPNFDWQTYAPEEWAASQEYARQHMNDGRSGLFGVVDRVSSGPVGDAVKALSKPVGQAADYFRDKIAPLSPYLAGAAITGGAASEFLPGLMAAEGAATAPAVEGGLGSVTMNSTAPGFTTSGALTPAFGGATFGPPATLEAAQAALASAAAPSLMETAARYATPGNLAKVAQTARSLTSKPAAGRSPTGSGQDGQSNRSNPYTDPVLDTTESFLTGGGGGADKYDLAKVYHQMSPGDTGGYPVMAASGGSLSDLLKESFSEKNLFPQSKDLDDRPMILTSQNPGIKTDLAKIKRIKHMGMAQGGLPHKYAAAAPHGHHPEFITGITGHYACGKGTGQSDDIPAMLHDGDYVMDAETVSALGDGSSKAGKEVLEGFHKRIPYKRGGQAKPVPAKIADGEYVFDAGFVTALGGGDNRRGSEILDGLREKLRAHKRGAPVNKIPPKAKDPAQYIGKGK